MQLLQALFLLPLVLAADDAPAVRQEILNSYQHSFEALRRGDADGAMAMDTADWVSIVVGQQPRTRQELEPYIRRDIASLKPPDNWSVIWKPDYEKSGPVSGILLYDVKIEEDTTIVLCLVGSARTETVDGVRHTVWAGSHIRDTWTKTPAGWKRRKHEKLTINERLIFPG